MISFHRPPVETDVQVDVYFGRATIGTPASFTIAPDGGSVALMMHRANGRVPFGTMTPGDAGALKLELHNRQQGQTEVLLTRDREEIATEPRQKEARELFAMWKITANDDGTIPGTFIDMLAVEVRAYVKANPNLDSGMKLPKLLPRFDTKRDWTAAEAIQLLDDVAYYATAPIEARVANAKLPSDALWRTKVPFEDIPVAIANWSEAKDGLRIGMRVSEGDWRLGGKVRLELWVHNAGAKDAAFNANPGRADFGLSIAAKDAEGNDHWAKGGNISNIAIPLHCTLPAGFVAQVKDFELSFEEAWFGPKFRDLKPGKYKLRCVWSDPHPSTATKDDWIGTLTTPELDFTLAGSDTAAVREANSKAAAAKPAGKLSVANRTGKYDLGGGRSLYICRPDEQRQWFSILWPESERSPKCLLRIEPNLAKHADVKWAAVWEPGADILWWADETDVAKVRLTDPANVLVDREGRENNFSRDFGLTDEVKEQFRKLGFVIGRDKTPGRELLIGGNTGGQTVLSAQTQEEWIVEGTVTDADGKPLANVPINARSEYRPTVDLATAITDAQGRYGVVFSLDLETFEKFRGIEVRPALAGFTERELANNGAFNALLFAGEQPQRVPPPNPRIDEEFKAGPIPRFGARDLVAAQPARADFVMLPAGEIVGRIVTTEGAPLPNYFISLAAPQQLAGYSVASTSSDQRGQFRLAGIPTNQPLIFTTNPGGNPSATIKSAPERFETAKIASVRIVMPPPESGAPLTIERTEGGSDAGAAAAESEKTPPAADAASGTRPDPGSVVTMRGYTPGVGESRELIEHCHAIAAAHGRPQATGAELVAWGDETRGLRAGLLMAPRAELGVPLPAWIVIRNVSKETIRVPLVLSWNTTPVVTRDADGKPIAVSNPQLFGTDAILQCLLEPGEQVDMKTQLIQFGGEKNKGAVSRVEMGIGKCEVNIDLSRADRRPTPEAADLGRFKTLATGRVAVEVTPAKPAPRRAGFTDGSDLGSSAAESRSVIEAAVVELRLELERAEATLARLAKLRSGNFVSSQEVDEAKMKVEVLKAEIAGDKTGATRARLAHAETELKRATELSGQKLISQQEVDEMRMKVEVLKAELMGDKTAAARARLAHAEAELKRVTEAHSQRLISSQELDQAKAAVEVRKAELTGDRLAVARAQLAQAEAQLKRVAALREQKLIAEAEYENAEMAVVVARAAIEAAKSQPQSKPGEGLVVVEIHADGTIHIGAKKLSLTELEKHLAELRRKDPALAATLVAAKAVDYASVTAVLNVLKTAGIGNPTLQAWPSTADNAPAPQQKWMATGRVTDEEGKPIEGVLISVDAGMGSLFQTGKATTGADGHYTVEFTQGVMMERDSPGLQFANITAHKPRFFEKNLNRHGAGAMALRAVAAEDLKGYGVAADVLALPGRPRVVDFVMLPAARLKGRLLGTGKFSDLTPAEVRKDPKAIAGFTELNRSPLAGWQLWLKGKALPPGASVICTTRTDKDGNFVMEDVPTGYEWQLLGETNRHDVREALSRNFLKLRKAADYTVSLHLPEAQDKLELSIEAYEASFLRGEAPEFSN
ncbi:MAG TPA: biopolymer transporter ExbD [Chthoniobacteraceae bacterium]|nr:biopolymer transporter ExbD [Chthoniobacteraceae bacterium]